MNHRRAIGNEQVVLIQNGDPVDLVLATTISILDELNVMGNVAFGEFKQLN